MSSLIICTFHYVAHMKEMKNCIQHFGQKIWRTRRHRNKWKDNIRMDLREIGWKGVDWIHLTQDRNHWHALVNRVMNLWVWQKTVNFFTFLKKDSDPWSLVYLSFSFAFVHLFYEVLNKHFFVYASKCTHFIFHMYPSKIRLFYQNMYYRET